MTKDNSKQFCFTIMPFKGYFNEYYSKIYSIAIREANLEPIRADDIYTPGTIVNDIWDAIQKSQIILADLTNQNANVFYELGLAHASSKPVILISETIEDIPFDLRALRIILYDKNVPDWGTILKDNIVRTIKETIATPLRSILPAFLNITKSDSPTVTESEKVILELKSDIELLKQGQQPNRFKLATNFDDIQIKILKLISEGNSQKEIADKLSLNLSTVEKTLNNLMVSFNVQNLAQLTTSAMHVGII